jgi:hypothetical protein
MENGIVCENKIGHGKFIERGKGMGGGVDGQIKTL